MFINLKKERYMQYLASVTASISSGALGMVATWPSPTIPKLHDLESSPLEAKLSDEELSWVVASVLLAMMPGSITSSWFVEHLGRKRTLLLAGVLTLMHWLVLIFANSFALLVIGRVIVGFAMGIDIPAGVIYVAEIADEDIRGQLFSFGVLTKTIGSVIVLVVGPYVSYTALGIICACGPLIFLCCFFSMPESPYYYIMKGRKEEAKKSLRRLAKKDTDEEVIDDKLLFMKNMIEEHMKNRGSYLELFTKKNYRWLLFLMFGVQSLQQLNGSTALDAYLQPIIEASNSGLDPRVASIIIGCIQIPAVILSGILLDKIGRKPLLIPSAALCCVALIGEGTYFLIQDYLLGDTTSLGWLPTTGLALFWIMNAVGILPIPFLLLGEIFPTNIKGPAISAAMLYTNLTGFLVSKFFLPASNAIGIYSVFYIFAGVCFLGVPFTIFILPETKEKNFQEIEDLLRNKKKRDDQ